MLQWNTINPRWGGVEVKLCESLLAPGKFLAKHTRCSNIDAAEETIGTFSTSFHSCQRVKVSIMQYHLQGPSNVVESDSINDNTVKLVQNPRDLSKIWSLYTGCLSYAGSITWKIYLWGLVKCGLYIQVSRFHCSMFIVLF